MVRQKQYPRHLYNQTITKDEYVPGSGDTYWSSEDEGEPAPNSSEALASDYVVGEQTSRKRKAEQQLPRRRPLEEFSADSDSDMDADAAEDGTSTPNSLAFNAHAAGAFKAVPVAAEGGPDYYSDMEMEQQDGLDEDEEEDDGCYRAPGPREGGGNAVVFTDDDDQALSKDEEGEAPLVGGYDSDDEAELAGEKHDLGLIGAYESIARVINFTVTAECVGLPLAKFDEAPEALRDAVDRWTSFQDALLPFAQQPKMRSILEDEHQEQVEGVLEGKRRLAEEIFAQLVQMPDAEVLQLAEQADELRQDLFEMGIALN
ncbi:hypothetical protein GGR56DRAFT_65064 [Xylariaceae sp. FL0804]|nr:hypothetical protein GGR56DRAFT_65064 [Xylariaceae sp. FL0804]